MESKEVSTPLDSKFFPVPIVKILESCAITCGQFLSKHTKIDETCTHGDCGLCGTSLSPKASIAPICKYLDCDDILEANCLALASNKCQHKFHVGCFHFVCPKTCPTCNEYFYSSPDDLVYATRVEHHLARLDAIDPDALVKHLSWIFSGDPLPLDTNFFVFCVLTVAYKLQNSIAWEFTPGKMSRPRGHFGGIEKHSDGRFVVESIIDAIKELDKNEDEEPAVIPSGKVREFSAEELLHDGQGHKVLRFAPFLLGGRLSDVWKRVTLKVIRNDTLRHQHSCFSYGAQVLVLAVRHYLSEVEEAMGDEEDSGDWDDDEAWYTDSEDLETKEDSCDWSTKNGDISTLDLNEVQEFEEDSEAEAFLEQ